MLPRLLGGIFLALPFVDLAALAFPNVGVIGMAVWGLAWIALFGFAIHCLVGLVHDVAAGRWLLTSFVAVLLAAIFLYHVNDPKSLHHETTQEIGQALDQLEHARHRGFTGTVLFGYPARQFLVPALPSIFLGRNLTALHLGTAAYLVVALLIFTRGLTRFLAKTLNRDLLAAILLSFIPHFYFFNHCMLSFEQAIFPCLFGMLVCGVALHFGESQSRWLPWLLGLAGLMLAHAYVPALAPFLLVEVWLLGAALSPHAAEFGGRRILLTLASGCAVSLVASLAYRQDLRFTGDHSLADFWRDLFEALRLTLATPNAGELAASPFVIFPVLLAVAASLLLFAGWPGLLLGVWTVVVALSSVAFKGMWWTAISARIGRGIVALPFLLCLMALLWRRNLGERQGLRPLLAAVLLMSVPIGLVAHREYLLLREPPRNAAFIAWLDATVATRRTDPPPVVVFEFPWSDERFENLNDLLPYFRPDFSRTLRVRDDEGCEAVNRFLNSKPVSTVLVATTTDPPAHSCLATRPAEEIGTFTFGDNPPITLRRFVYEAP